MRGREGVLGALVSGMSLLVDDKPRRLSTRD